MSVGGGGGDVVDVRALRRRRGGAARRRRARDVDGVGGGGVDVRDGGRVLDVGDGDGVARGTGMVVFDDSGVKQ